MNATHEEVQKLIHKVKKKKSRIILLWHVKKKKPLSPSNLSIVLIIKLFFEYGKISRQRIKEKDDNNNNENALACKCKKF